MQRGRTNFVWKSPGITGRRSIQYMTYADMEEGVLGVEVEDGLGNRLFRMASGLAIAERCGVRLRFEGWRTPPRVHSDRDYAELVERFRALPVYRPGDAGDDERTRSAYDVEIRDTRPDPSTQHDIAANRSIEEVVRREVAGGGRSVLVGSLLQAQWYLRDGGEARAVDLLREEPREVAARIAQLFPDRASTLDRAFFVHVRLGDYVDHPVHWVPTVHGRFYSDAIAQLPPLLPPPPSSSSFSSSLLVLVVAEGRAEAERRIAGLEAALRRFPQVVTLEESNELVCLYVMAACRLGGVVPNSTFSWWGAALNPNPDKIVLMSGPWTTTSTSSPSPGTEEKMDHVHPPWARLWWPPATTTNPPNPEPLTGFYSRHNL